MNFLLVHNCCKRRLVILTTLICCLVTGRSAQAQDKSDSLSRPLVKQDLPAAVRRPIGMEWVVPGEQLIVANRRSRSLELIEVSGERELVEFAFPWEISSLATIGDANASVSRRFAVTTSQPGQLVLCDVQGRSLYKGESLMLSAGPMESHIAVNSNVIVVSSVWDRTVWVIDLVDTLKIRFQVNLSFEPGVLCFRPNAEQVVVADAFRGHLVLIDLVTGVVSTKTEIEGHNIRGGAFLNPDRFMITHQILHADSPTTEDHIAAGNVIENVFQEFEIEETAVGDVALNARVQSEIGEPSHGAADPGAIAITRSGTRFVTLSGNDELLRLNRFGVAYPEIQVGDRPIDLLLSPDESDVYCLNQFDETISRIDTTTGVVVEQFSLGLSGHETAIDRGERLFFDATKSKFAWFSCHSCHGDGHTNDGLADTFGDGSSGAPKRVLSLLGGRDNNPWAWNGSHRSLHDQVRQSGRSTMRGEGFSPREINDLVAFLHSLDFPPAFRPARDAEDEAQIARGREVFEQQGCQVCHVGPLTFTSDAVYDVGLTDEHGQREFNPPSLRGVGYRRRLLHDGRVKSLRELLVDETHQLSVPLNDADVDDLIRFLESL